VSDAPHAECPIFVDEGDALDCQCSPPKPDMTSATITWGEHSNTSRLFVNRVSWRDNDGPAKNATYIDGPVSFSTDGSKSLTLTCRADHVNPRPIYTWGDPCNDGKEKASCTFRPDPAMDDGRKVRCRGGKPLVSKVKFSCTNPVLPDQPDVQMANASSSSLTLSSSVPRDHDEIEPENKNAEDSPKGNTAVKQQGTPSGLIESGWTLAVVFAVIAMIFLCLRLRKWRQRRGANISNAKEDAETTLLPGSKRAPQHHALIKDKSLYDEDDGGDGGQPLSSNLKLYDTSQPAEDQNWRELTDTTNGDSDENDDTAFVSMHDNPVKSNLGMDSDMSSRGNGREPDPSTHGTAYDLAPALANVSVHPDPIVTKQTTSGQSEKDTLIVEAQNGSCSSSSKTSLQDNEHETFSPPSRGLARDRKKEEKPKKAQQGTLGHPRSTQNNQLNFSSFTWTCWYTSLLWEGRVGNTIFSLNKS
ncbi:hypothetical protein BaRGS_00029700, partial [Batillaria attramentaria]